VPDASERPGRLTPVGAAEFAARMAQLGPFEPAPRIGVAVSGGADSMALALLADRWARDAGGSVLALIVDHGLRAGSAAEAALAADRLAGRGIDRLVLTLTDLPHGAGLAERARLARYHALTQACASAGIVHLLLGHHLADQAETLLIRALGGSAASGMAAMSPLVETAELRLLRPLLAVAPARLRAHLQMARAEWIEDPSNQDTRALRPRLRALRADRDGTGSVSAALAASAAAAGRARAVRETRCAAAMARTVTLRPEGFAILPAGPVAPDVFAALVQAISGADYPADTAAIAALAAAPRPATLAGVRLIEAGAGILMLREEAAIAPAMKLRDGVVWDGRFRVRTVKCPLGHPPSGGTLLGHLGAAAAGLRRRSGLPSAVLRTLPALWMGETLVAVPHLGYYVDEMFTGIELGFSPPRPAAPAAFVAEPEEGRTRGREPTGSAVTLGDAQGA
jgi:tRNA(Ile)-lysidine synthase